MPPPGLPAYHFFRSQLVVYLFLLLLYPFLCVAGAAWMSMRYSLRSASSLLDEYLLEPRHWFAIWRLNSVLVAYHARLTGLIDQYAMEDKVCVCVCAFVCVCACTCRCTRCVFVYVGGSPTP